MKKSRGIPKDGNTLKKINESRRILWIFSEIPPNPKDGRADPIRKKENSIYWRNNPLWIAEN